MVGQDLYHYFQPLLQEWDGHLTPLGWTAKGKLLYVSYCEDNEPSLHFFIGVQDMITDKTLFRLSFTDGETIEIEADEIRTDDIDEESFGGYMAVILERINEITSLFDSYEFSFSSASQESGLHFRTNPEYENYIYGVKDTLEEETNSPYGTHHVFMYRYDRKNNSWASKEIGTVPEGMMGVPNRYSYLVSPFNNRIAVVVFQQEP